MEYSNEAILTVWGGSLLIALVVVVVVAILLRLIIRTASKIDTAAGEIWTQGKLVANNTIQIPLFLATTNQVGKEILGSAVHILQGAQKVEKHIEGCPGCPDCVLGN